MLDHGLFSHALIGCAGLALYNRLHCPALVARQWPGFHDLHLITDLAADLVMGLHPIARVDHLLVKRMAVFTCDLDHNGLGHFVAGDHTNQTSTIVHFAPSTAARSDSRRMVSMRAMLRRSTLRLLVSVN